MGGAAARYLAGTLLLAAVAIGAGSARAAPPAPPSEERSGVQILRAIAYKPGSSSDAHTLDLYLPGHGAAQPGERPPLFVYIHGGAWVSGDRRQYVRLGAGLLAQGVAVAVINYRLSDVGKDPHPAHVQDAAAAVAFLRKEAARYGYDPERIFVGGHSAGAHISALLAFAPGAERGDQLLEAHPNLRRLLAFVLPFYMMALGMVTFDPYAFGYQPWAPLILLAPIGFGLWWQRQDVWLMILAADLAAYAGGFFANLWDALFDPLLVLLALIVAARPLAFRLIASGTR